jgi:photosystem II stability/assembly factor-like uncharacterized protein
MSILAGTSRGVFSLDGGGSAPCLASRGVRELAEIQGRVFAGTGAGLYSSDDWGASWSEPVLTDLEVWQVRAAADGSIYAGTQPAGLFKSIDQGQSWESVSTFQQAADTADWCIPVDPPLPGRARALVTHKTDPARMWVGVEVGGIASTTDGGESWTMNLPGDNPDLHMMVAHPEHPEELYASTGYGRLDGVAEMVEGNAGMFRSTDGGQTWHYIWSGITPRYSRPLCIDPRAPYPITVASAPTAFSSFRDEDGAQAMLFRTEDGGESWRSLCDTDHSPSQANIHGLTPDPDQPGGVIIGTDTGEVWRVSNEAEWALQAEGLPAVLALLG